MRSTIYSADAIDNKVVEFGEAADLRYWAMFVDDHGAETPIALTPKQVAVGRERAGREPPDREAFVRAYRRRAILQNVGLGLALILSAAIGGVVTTMALLP